MSRHVLFCRFLAICVLHLSVQACQHTSSHHLPSNTPSNTAGQSVKIQQNTAVESQLLETVKHAESLGRGNPFVLSSLYSLASYYRSQGQYDKAELQYQKALQLKEEQSGPDHPDLVTILENYADLLRDAKRYTEADNLSSRAAAILAKYSPRPPTKLPSR
ncbi:MAG: tetratricopeptide repeat protein [Nitrospira sp.]|nr:tetratricopeptide repeat protein [Nitrospira sp.]